jgi:hypothetical protein
MYLNQHIRKELDMNKKRLFTLLTIISLTISFLSGCAGKAGSEPPDPGDPNQEPVSNDGPPITLSTGSDRVKVLGQVTDKNGAPLVEVSVVVTKGTVSIPEMAIVTDENGEYIWYLPPGTFTLTATKEGYIQQSVEVKIEAGASPLIVNFTLSQ